MSFTPEQLWNLLPAHLRLRDTELANPNGPDATGQWNPGPLRELVEVIASQVAVLDEELDQLYENHFAETAASWALPYLGDLLGIRGLGGAGPSARLAPRAEVANTLAYRRRKGTAAVLEQLARDATGWPAAAVEFFQRLATTQHLNHVRLRNHSWLSLRPANRLESLDTPFEDAARTIEVRRIRPGLGKWNLPNVGVFLYRLQAHSRTRSPLAPAHLPDGRHFRFHPLGLDTPLALNPITETEITHLARPENVPLLLTRRSLAGARLHEPGAAGPVPVEPAQYHPDSRFYGTHAESSLLLELPAATPGDPPVPVPADRILICDLHDVPDVGDPTLIVRWGHDGTNDDANPGPGLVFPGMVLLDPQRGRVVFPTAPTGDPLATFHLLFPAELGGGEYARVASFGRDSLATDVVSEQNPPPAGEGHSTLAAAVGAATAGNAVIEIHDSGHYVETLPPLVANTRSLELRGADRSWPVLTLENSLRLEGDRDGAVVLNGLLITGAGPAPPPPILVGGQLGTLRIRHCTLLPGLRVNADGQLDLAAARPPALTIEAPTCVVTIEDSILGPIRVAPDARVTLRRCLVDAGADDRTALGGLADGVAAGSWTLENCTVIGNVAAHLISLASNSIFLSRSVMAERRQEGCVRFCWLPTDARVPRRHRCLPRDETDPRTGADLRAVRPLFASRRYGHPAYGQLSLLSPEPIQRGADDEGEPGVYHDLFQPQREAHARVRLDEYLPFGLEIGLFQTDVAQRPSPSA